MFKDISLNTSVYNLMLYLRAFWFAYCFISGWAYSSGFVNADMIKEHLPAPEEGTLILMCGPPPMINFACLPNLEKLGYTAEMKFAY